MIDACEVTVGSGEERIWEESRVVREVGRCWRTGQLPPGGADLLCNPAHREQRNQKDGEDKWKWLEEAKGRAIHHYLMTSKTSELVSSYLDVTYRYVIFRKERLDAWLVPGRSEL